MLHIRAALLGCRQQTASGGVHLRKWRAGGDVEYRFLPAGKAEEPGGDEGVDVWDLGLSFSSPGSDILTCAKLAAQVDAYVVWRYGGEQFGGWKGRFWMHLVGGLAVGATAWCM